jgi:hypothetical protein
MVLVALREVGLRVAAVAIGVGRVALLTLECVVSVIAVVAVETLVSSWISG